MKLDYFLWTFFIFLPQTPFWIISLGLSEWVRVPTWKTMIQHRWVEPTSSIPGSKCHHRRSNESTVNFGKWRFWTWNEKLIIMPLDCCKDVHVGVHVLMILDDTYSIVIFFDNVCIHMPIVWYYSSICIARDLGWYMIQPPFILPVSARELSPGASESFQRGGLVRAGTTSD